MDQTSSDSSSMEQSDMMMAMDKSTSSSKQFGRVNRRILDKDSEEYRKRRERNNLAVKKSRNKSKQKTQQTQQRVNELKEENQRLETKVKILSKELSFLKDLFLAHASSHSGGQTIDLNLNNEESLMMDNNNRNANNNGQMNQSHVISSSFSNKLSSTTAGIKKH
ncbi:CCAAT/enhancer-binding protein gamma-like protein [Euroglyphus maynei]|uniref:CCAAT/enhancer-binding protein gamma n=1 Tax=Euroglyphus maynei TaxID=6958 RepID=A0A1Y3BL08_EURMA|nr:CCAAT/enhancer-binding protein gamma-like protein [Euroglyphus maynei]